MSELKPLGELLPDPKERRQADPKWTPDQLELSEKDRLVLELMEIGVAMRKAEYLVMCYPEKRIRQQIKWLPHRSANSPASLLITAIERNFDAPAYLRKT